MAENKRSFILYADILATVEKLNDQKAGKLFKIILQYVNDKNPVVDDLLLQIAFEPIKQQLKRALKDWEKKKEQRSENGIIGNLKRWNIDLYDKVMSEEITIKEAEEIAKNRKTSGSDNIDRQLSPPIANIAVNVNDTVNVNVIKKEKSFPVMPKVEDVGELPELKINSSIELLRITQQTDVTKTDIEKLWVVFKIQNLTGKKYYADVEAVHSHFINWVKTQRITKPIRAPEKEKQSTPLRTADYYK